MVLLSVNRLVHWDASYGVAVHCCRTALPATCNASGLVRWSNYNGMLRRRITLFCHVGMAPCRSAVGNREIMDEVRMYVIRRPHGVIPEFLAPMPKMTEEGSSGSRTFRRCYGARQCQLR